MLATRKLPSASIANPLGAPRMLPTSVCPPSGSIRIRAARLSDTHSVPSRSATMHSGRDRLRPARPKSCACSLKLAIPVTRPPRGLALEGEFVNNRTTPHSAQGGPMTRFVRFAIASLLAGAAMAAGAQSRAPVTLNHLTAPAGIGEYEWGLTIDRILAKQSTWLRQRSQPTQGYIYNLRTAIDGAANWNTMVFNIDPVRPWLASKEQAPFEIG